MHTLKNGATPAAGVPAAATLNDFEDWLASEQVMAIHGLRDTDPASEAHAAHAKAFHHVTAAVRLLAQFKAPAVSTNTNATQASGDAA